MINRNKLQSEYVESVIDGMDIQDLCALASDYLHGRLEDLSDNELVEEIENFYPHLLPESEE